MTALPKNPARLFSVDNAKAAKASGYGWLNAILYMAPATAAGVGNLCPHASAGCIAACLGMYSGQAAILKKGEDLNHARRARIAKAQAFMRDRQNFLRSLAIGIARLGRTARKDGLSLCVRLNGATDIAWEGCGVEIDEGTASAIRKAGYPCETGRFASLMHVFPNLQFVEYTKNPFRMTKQARGILPRNLYLTFSRSESNEATAREVLAMGQNVAVVFGGDMPKTWNGYRVVSGDNHDLRHLDPRGCVVGLTPKGNRAKKDRSSGFIVWSDPAQAAPAIISETALAA